MKKNLFLILFLAPILWGCSNEIVGVEDLQPVTKEVNEPLNFERLTFENEIELLNSIQNSGDFKKKNSGNYKTKSGNQFISLMDPMPENSRLKYLPKPVEDDGGKPIDAENPGVSYYDALNYEELLPNKEFAALFNPEGELVVNGEVIKVTPNGTYKYPISKENEFRRLFAANPNVTGALISEDTYQIANGILLYDTYKDDTENLELIEEGDTFLYPNSYFGDPEDELELIPILKAASVPDYDSFATYSNTRKTWAGKLIQNIFQTSVTPTINFSKSRRLRGKFYQYNWFVYSEAGVTGWTDKKNGIGWSKTASSELRVGWRGVVLETKLSDFYADAFKTMNETKQLPAVNMKLPGYTTNSLNTIALYSPNANGDVIFKYAKLGAKPLFNFLKGILTDPTALEKAQAIMITNRTHMYTIILNEEIIKYNEKSYTHVFANQVKFAVSLDLMNIPGFSTWKDAGQWAKAVGETTKMAYPTLKGGEVYVCSKFDNVWKGMKIVKKD